MNKVRLRPEVAEELNRLFYLLAEKQQAAQRAQAEAQDVQGRVASMLGAMGFEAQSVRTVTVPDVREADEDGLVEVTVETTQREES